MGHKFFDNVIEKVAKGEDVTLHKPSTEVFSADLNIKAFYNELHDVLVKEGFKDNLSPKNHAKAGELITGEFNRTGDIFEKEFVTIERGWAKELEIRWIAIAKLPTSPYGLVTFKLDLVVRNMQDKELLDEKNNKKVLQTGKWEFRNQILYSNSIVNDFLKKVPIVKNYESLQKLYLENIYNKKIEEEVMFCLTKVKPLVYGVINKYFT